MPRKGGDRSEDRRATYEAELYALGECEVVQHGKLATFVSPDKERCRILYQNEVDQVEGQIRRALDITAEFQRTRKDNRRSRKEYGTDNRPTIFTAKARHRILEAGAVADRWHRKSGSAAFVTLTLPGSSADAIRTFAAWSGYVCNRLTQYLRRAKEGVLWFYSWEWQARGALHMHLYLRSAGQEVIRLGEQVKAAWYRILEDISAKSGCNLFFSERFGGSVPPKYWQADVRPITYGSAAAYISKYVGKGGNYQARKAAKGFGEQRYYPARWWGMCRELKRMVDDERVEVRIVGLTDEEARRVLDIADSALYPSGRVGTYSYEFDISYGSDSHRRTVAEGIRFIHYYDDSSFDKVCVALRPLIAHILQIMPNAWMQYRYGSPLHGCNSKGQSRIPRYKLA